MLEGASFLTMESHGADDAIVVTTVREPPVCGEWSYDDSELEDPRFVAGRIDGEDRPMTVAVPVEPIRVAIDAGAARTRARPTTPPPLWPGRRISSAVATPAMRSPSSTPRMPRGRSGP